MRTCEDGCNGCDECTDWDDQGHRPPRFLRDEHDIAAWFAEQADPKLKPDIAALTKRMADDPAFAAQVTGEKAAMHPELALFFRDLRNYLLHVIDMSKGEHYLDVVRLNAQALIRRMELLAAASDRTADWYMAVVWPLLPVPGEFDDMDACDQSRWLRVVRTAIACVLAGERPLTDHDRALTGAKLTDTSGTDC